MNLSVREAATLLGRSPRTVRAQLARGELNGKKKGGRWTIERRALPLTERQREALQTKADGLRQALDEALPSSLATHHGQRTRSLADLDAFRLGAELLGKVRTETAPELDESLRQRVAALLEGSLLALAEAVQQFDRELKRDATRRARAGLAHATALLLLAGPLPPGPPVLGWVSALETEVVPAVAGFARWADGLKGGRR